MEQTNTIMIFLAVLLGVFILLTMTSVIGYTLFVVIVLVICLYALSLFAPASLRTWIPPVPWAKPKETPKEKVPLTSNPMMKQQPEGGTAESSSPAILTNVSSILSAADLSNQNQAFHVQGLFDYTTARSVCKAYGAKLATFDQIKKAHDKGAEWCDYGWSEDSMVLFPTQYKSWSIYKETDEPQRCGIPGVNGGYNNDVGQQLGANCFGKRPKGTLPPFSYPKTKQSHPPEYTVSPFNYTSWSGF